MTTMLEHDVDVTETVGDLLHRLGDIAPSRVRLHPAPGTARVEDVVAIDAKEGRLFELIDGVLVEKGMGLHESILAGAILGALRNWARPGKLGFVAGEGGMFRVLSEQVRIPDVLFASWDAMPGRRLPPGPVPAITPDLVVEVLSVSNTKREMERKRGEYFAAGVKLVWEVDPVARRVWAYSALDKVQALGENDTLDGGGVLPGFQLNLGQLFAELDESGA
jgi:Uma2 family endonuclease